MSRYVVLWKANPSAWPNDPKQALAVLEAVAAGGDQLLKAGAIKELGWFTGQDGYAIFEADSKDSVLGMVQPFFPYYSQDIHEVVPWESGKQAILASSRQAASR
ncbi:MAG: hypothetical protein HW416_3650 [Chloroflexi bacterium]|nr:hypothetical protein [Chloroflexota bacterium]